MAIQYTLYNFVSSFHFLGRNYLTFFVRFDRGVAFSVVKVHFFRQPFCFIAPLLDFIMRVYRSLRWLSVVVNVAFTLCRRFNLRLAKLKCIFKVVTSIRVV